MSEGYFLANQVVRILKPGQRRSTYMRLDHIAYRRMDSGYVHLTGWRVRRDGVKLYWTSAYVPFDSVTLV